jgi:hypothetical protein
MSFEGECVCLMHRFLHPPQISSHPQEPVCWSISPAALPINESNSSSPSVALESAEITSFRALAVPSTFVGQLKIVRRRTLRINTYYVFSISLTLSIAPLQGSACTLRVPRRRLPWPYYSAFAWPQRTPHRAWGRIEIAPVFGCLEPFENLSSAGLPEALAKSHIEGLFRECVEQWKPVRCGWK